MKLRLKLPLAFGFTLALLLLAALFGIHTLHRSVGVFDTDVPRYVAQERAALQIETRFKTQVQEWKNTLLRGQQDEQRLKYWKAFQSEEDAVASAARGLLATLPDGQSRSLVEQFLRAHTKMGQGYRKGYDAFVAANFAAAVGDAEVKGMDREPVKLLAEASKRIAADSAAVAQEASAAGRRAIVLSLAVMLAVTVLGVIVGVAVSRTIVRPIDQAVQLARAVADGDLTVRVGTQGRDEVAELLSALGHMQEHLTRLVRQVRQNADGVALASEQISVGNHDLSTRTEQQASVLQQTSASMEQLGATVQRNADSAEQANRLARSASDVAAKGGAVVNDVVDTMKGIEDSSRKMADIVSVIDGIAFQTNILALNAAVEAARAGEQGRGFAVVAGEVRTLAQRSAIAAKEIKGLIAASVDRVEQGSALVDRAGSTMTDIVAAIQGVTTLMSEITIASSEQSDGVSQVGTAVTQMDRATQQNAALVEECAAAAEALKNQAAQLVASVAVFQLSDAAAAA